MITGRPDIEIGSYVYSDRAWPVVCETHGRTDSRILEQATLDQMYQDGWFQTEEMVEQTYINLIITKIPREKIVTVQKANGKAINNEWSETSLMHWVGARYEFEERMMVVCRKILNGEPLISPGG